MPSLKGRRVALLEARMSDEAASLVRRLGGTPVRFQQCAEVVHPESVGPFIDALGSGRISFVVFLTGVGVAALLREAARLERFEASRGSPADDGRAADQPVGRPPATHRPGARHGRRRYTTRELLEALAPFDLERKSVALVHYGEPNQALTASLALAAPSPRNCRSMNGNCPTMSRLCSRSCESW